MLRVTLWVKRRSARVIPMDMLEGLFGSPARVKVLKVFVMNPEERYSIYEVSQQVRLRPAAVLAEARRLAKLGLIRPSSTRVLAEPAATGRRKPRLARTKVFAANRDIPLFPELRMLFLKSAPHAKGQLASKIRRLGNVKLAILAGVFIDSPTSRADLLLVADGIKKARMKSFIQRLEAEVGKELNYVAMSSQEFRYRLDMYDRFVRDMLEFPHETVINKLGV